MLKLFVVGLTMAILFSQEVNVFARHIRQQVNSSHTTSQAVAPNSNHHTNPKAFTFSNPKASEFLVDGSSVPDVPFDLGPSWAGLIPISNASQESRKLFFWFFPPGPQGSSDDLILWTNGGPGCSSFVGLVQENGPFSWAEGTASPVINKFSWTNLSSVLWVEQPVGTGFSQGVANIMDQDDLAVQLVGFLGEFLKIFSELKGKNFYLSGESYAGAYVPYTANYIYEHHELLDLRLQGIWINDPLLSWSVVQREIPAMNFVDANENVFAFNETFKRELQMTAARCNYSDYFAKHVTYPPNGLLPLPGGSTEANRECDIWDHIDAAVALVNPVFNPYNIFEMFPARSDILRSPQPYFDRPEVKKAIHAPLNVTWTECASGGVFVNDIDTSLPSAFTVLPNVIEKSKRAVIVHGLADFILIADGTRIVIQNMTWNGQQGFHSHIVNESFVVDGVGSLGNMHTERGLTYVEVALSGHMVPQFSPRAAFQIMQYLMGFRDTP